MRLKACSHGAPVMTCLQGCLFYGHQHIIDSPCVCLYHCAKVILKHDVYVQFYASYVAVYGRTQEIIFTPSSLCAVCASRAFNQLSNRFNIYFSSFCLRAFGAKLQSQCCNPPKQRQSRLIKQFNSRLVE